VVGVEELERVDRVLLGQSAVGACGFQAGVAEEFGDDDEVGAAAYESCREGVAQDVRGDVVALEACSRGDRRDDVVRASDCARADASRIGLRRRDRAYNDAGRRAAP